MTATLATRTPWRTPAVAVLFAIGTLLLVHGFASTDIVDAGLRSAWQPKGVRQFTAFVLTTLAMTLAATRLGRTRSPLLLLAALWLGSAFGIGALASVVLIAAAALGLGTRVSRGAAFANGDPLEVALLRSAAGLAVIVATVQVLVHFPINSRQLHLLLLCGALWLGREGLHQTGARLRTFCRSQVEQRQPLYAVAVLLTVLAAHSAVAALPEVGSDALAMHLVIPGQVASQARWSFDFRGCVWALVPMGADWLYTTAHLLGGESAARLCNFAALVAIAFLVRGQLRRSLPAPLASLMTAGCAAAPIVFMESFSLWVENLLTLFLLSAAVIAARSWSRPGRPDVAAFALCAGGALITKSLGLFCLPLVAAMGWSVARSAAPMRPRIGHATLGLAVLIGVGGGPYLYAFAVTGNPLFPFFNDIFQSPYYDSGRFVDPRWIGHGGYDLLYQMTFRSGRYGELYDGALGFHHMVLLMPGLLVGLSTWPRAGRAVLLATLAMLVVFIWSTQYLRYLYPFLWAAAVLEAQALRLLIAVPSQRRPALATVALALLTNIVFMPTGFYLLRDFPVQTAFSSEERDRFVTDEAPYRKLNAAVNAASGTHARVLYLGSPYGGVLEGVPVYTNWYNPDLAVRVQQAATVEMAARILADERITHVAIESDPDLPLFRQWLAAHGRKMLSLGGADIFEIEAPSAASP